MSKTAIDLYRIAIIIIAPAVMMVSFVYHPHVGNPIDADFLEKLAAAVMADTTRWGVVHYLTGVGCGLMMLAFLAVRSHFQETAGEPWSGLGLPFIILGNTFYALLPAMEFAPMAAAETGADVQAIQAALMPWFVPTLFTSAVLFGIGAAGFAAGVIRGGVRHSKLKWIVAGSLIIMALCRFVPLNIFQFYVQGTAGIIALWILAYEIRQQSYLPVTVRPETVTAAGNI